MESMKLVYIRWLDAQGDHGHVSKEELNVTNGLPVETVGFLVSENEDVVRITTDVLYFDGSTKYRCTNVIPRAYIQEMQIFEIGGADAEHTSP